MARSLSQTLTLTRLGPARLVVLRRRSNQPEGFSGTGFEPSDKNPAATEEMERIALKKLEDAIHRIIVKRSEPDWLPLVPGASYWVPPRSKARGFAEVIGKLASNSTISMAKNDQALSLTYDRGWPSSAYFFKGASHSPLEGETVTKHTSQSEDEEG